MIKPAYMLFLIALLSVYTITAAIFANSQGYFFAKHTALLLSTLAVTIMASSTSYLIRSYKFKLLLHREDAELPFRYCLLYYISGFAMSVTPARTGEMLRCWLMKQKENIDYTRSLTACIADRTFDLLAILMLSAIAGWELIRLLGGNTGNVIIWSSILAGISTLLIILVLFNIGKLTKLNQKLLLATSTRSGKKGDLVHKLASALIQITGALSKFSFTEIGLYGLLSCLPWVIEATALAYIANQFGADMVWSRAIALLSLAYLISAISAIPGGLASTELVIISGLVASGLAKSDAIIATSMFRICILLYGVSLGLIFFTLLHFFRKHRL